MSTVAANAAFAYELADEVVVELDGVDAFDLVASDVMERWRLPLWTIGDVVGRAIQHGRLVYAIRFRHGDALCIALVDESSIDGTA